jgi:hypothetical protein
MIRKRVFRQCREYVSGRGSLDNKNITLLVERAFKAKLFIQNKVVRRLVVLENVHLVSIVASLVCLGSSQLIETTRVHNVLELTPSKWCTILVCRIVDVMVLGRYKGSMRCLSSWRYTSAKASGRVIVGQAAVSMDSSRGNDRVGKWLQAVRALQAWCNQRSHQEAPSKDHGDGRWTSRRWKIMTKSRSRFESRACSNKVAAVFTSHRNQIEIQNALR